MTHILGILLDRGAWNESVGLIRMPHYESWLWLIMIVQESHKSQQQSFGVAIIVSEQAMGWPGPYGPWTNL